MGRFRNHKIFESHTKLLTRKEQTSFDLLLCKKEKHGNAYNCMSSLENELNAKGY